MINRRRRGLGLEINGFVFARLRKINTALRHWQGSLLAACERAARPLRRTDRHLHTSYRGLKLATREKRDLLFSFWFQSGWNLQFGCWWTVWCGRVLPPWGLWGSVWQGILGRRGFTSHTESWKHRACFDPTASARAHHTRRLQMKATTPSHPTDNHSGFITPVFKASPSAAGSSDHHRCSSVPPTVYMREEIRAAPQKVSQNWGDRMQEATWYLHFPEVNQEWKRCTFCQDSCLTVSLM